MYSYIKMGCVEVNKKTYRSVSIGEPLKKTSKLYPTCWQLSEMVKILFFSRNYQRFSKKCVGARDKLKQELKFMRKF
jgi:hypothetical protein